ncbi:MAG: NUDIX domain-containing protein [Bacteroidales bacterium]|nr:NUDIX domain-containing protein [Bacteroidales bacterium]
MTVEQEYWLENLKQALLLPLPAEKAHIIAAPGDRVEELTNRKWPKNAKQSAVTFLLFPEEGEWYTLFMKRVEYDGVHSGQISLPGGQKDPIDTNLLQTAIREFEEETGVTLKQDHYLGALSDLYIPPSNFMVQPYVAVLDSLPALSPDLSEVQELHKIALKDLFYPENFKEEEIHLRQRGENSYTIKAPCYLVKGLRIWGATAMMISELQMIIEENQITLPQ